jgi:hypothetical protein
VTVGLEEEASGADDAIGVALPEDIIGEEDEEARDLNPLGLTGGLGGGPGGGAAISIEDWWLVGVMEEERGNTTNMLAFETTACTDFFELSCSMLFCWRVGLFYKETISDEKRNVGLILTPARHSIERTMSTSEYLRTLPSVRERCSKVFALGQQGELEYFTYHADKEPEVINYCAGIIEASRKVRSEEVPSLI